MSVLYCVAGDVDPLPSTDDSTVLGLIVCIVNRYGENENSCEAGYPEDAGQDQ